MDAKKQQILSTAMTLFLDKGYHKTSVQDIAEACNISKATIYKFFSAKEDVALGVVIYINRQLIYHIREIDRRHDLDPIEKLRAQLKLLINDYQRKNKFMDLLYLFFSGEQKEQYLPIMGKSRFMVFCEYSTMLEKAFNLPNEPIAWELTINMQGMIKEITLLDIHREDLSSNSLLLDKEIVIDFLIDSLAAIRQRRLCHPPLISSDSVLKLKRFYDANTTDQKPYCQRNQLFDELRQKITEESPAKRHKELLEAVTLIEQEFNKPSAKRLLVHSLWLYLAQRDELTDLLDELKNLIDL